MNEKKEKKGMKVLCMGDSLTECRALAQAEKWTAVLEAKTGCSWVNSGVGGDTTAGMLSRFQREIIAGGRGFTHCFIMGGINDLWFGVTWKEVLPNLYAMISQLRFCGIEAFAGIPPQIIPPESGKTAWQFPPVGGYDSFRERIAEYRRYLIGLCEAESLCYADIYAATAKTKPLDSADPDFFLADGLHFNPKGSQKAAECIYQALKNMI